MKKYKNIWRIIGLAVVLVLLLLFLRQVNFQEVYEQIRQVGWRFVLLLVVTGLGYFFGSWAWYLSFSKLQMKNPLGKLFVYRMIGETLALINPTSVVAGDAAKVYLLKQEGVSVEDAGSATLISRMLLIISLVFILILSSFFFLETSVFGGSIWWKGISMAALATFAFGLFFLLLSERLLLHRLVQGVLVFLGKDQKARLQGSYEINQTMVAYFKAHKGKFTFAFLLSVLHWLSGAMEFFIILWLLQIPIGLLDAVVLEMGVMVIKSLGAFIPGQIGVEEHGNRLMLSLIGVSTAGIWVVVSIFRRARQLVWLGIGMLLSVFFFPRGTNKMIKLKDETIQGVEETPKTI